MPCSFPRAVQISVGKLSKASCSAPCNQAPHCPRTCIKIFANSLSARDLSTKPLGNRRVSSIKRARVVRYGPVLVQAPASMSGGVEMPLAEQSSDIGATTKASSMAGSLDNGQSDAAQASVGRASDFEGEEPLAADPSTSGQSSNEAPGQAPLFRFGVITDVQHADIPDGASYGGTPRYYRHSLQVLRRAVDSWLASAPPVQFAVHFGDIVDGFCPRDQSEAAVQAVLNQFGRLPCRTYHMLGNHCLYNLPRARLNELLDIPGTAEGCSYYSFQPHSGFRFIVLDGYDVSMLGWPPEHPKTALAKAILATHNPNDNKNSPETLEGPSRRFVMFGGGISDAQLAWLESELGAAQRSGERVVVCCHLPLEPASTAPACLLWNYDRVLALLRAHSCVVATLAGHAHRGGYARDAAGIHHRVLEAALECPEGSDAYGCCDVYEDRLVLHGTDLMAGAEMPFRPAPSPQFSSSL